MSYCLRFDNQAHWVSFESLFAGEAIDVIGTIYQDGVAITGFHVNAMGEPPEAVVPYIVFPEHHYREFFGATMNKSIEFVGESGGIIYIDVNGVRYGFE